MKTPAFLASLLFIALTCIAAPAQQPAPSPAPAAPPAAVVAAPNQITVNVLGAVNRPSRYVLPEKATVVDALASAGDINRSGALSKVRLIRKTSGDKPDITIIDVKLILSGASTAPVLHDGDTVFVPENYF